MPEHETLTGSITSEGASEGVLVSLTDRAVARVKAIIERERRPAGTGLRVSVLGGGCSGLQYSLGFAEAPEADDTVYEVSGVRVFVDAMSAQYLVGTSIDYADGLHGAGFRFENPKAERTCGCGSSFAV
jgi:iron-sulfur cluster assembly accessory protein